MGIDTSWLIICLVSNAIAYGLGISSRRGKLDVTRKGARVRYRGAKDGKWKFGLIEEDIVGEQTLVILRGVELELDEIEQLVVKVSHRIFPIKLENMEILGYDDIWKKKDLI